VSRIVTQLSLAYPEVGFTLTSGGRQVLACPPAGSLRDRLYQVYGERTDLVPVDKEAAGVRVTGWAAALADHGPTRGPQNIFVNRRVVKDRTIAHAIIDSYSVASIKERSPEVHLFIEMAPGVVDVNVHPTKAEVRFREQSLVHEVVRRALRDALGQGAAPELVLQSEIAPASPVPRSIPGVVGSGVYPNRWIPQARTALPESRSSTDPRALDVEPPVGSDVAAREPDIRPMIPLGQFRDTFIIAVDNEGVAIIDQHVAHERVLFERIMEKMTAGRLESQRLLVPLVIELPPSALQALVGRAAELENLGFEIEEFGGAAAKVSAVPALLSTENCSNALRALAEDLEGLDRGAHVQEALRRIAATTACHAAVKANYPLTYEKMMHILDELRATAYSTVCPHGRPVMLRLTRREIEKNFDRI
jgi:DNA mismatch repair protein MutL